MNSLSNHIPSIYDNRWDFYTRVFFIECDTFKNKIRWYQWHNRITKTYMLNDQRSSYRWTSSLVCLRHLRGLAYASKMTNRLVEICRKDLPILKNLYSPNGVKNSFLAYLVIDNYIRWFKENSNLKHVKFFCLNGNFSDGTFVITVRMTFY